MTVKDLIERLKGIDGDMIVIMSQDEEGNGYSPIADVSYGHNYRADNLWSGTVGLAELTDDMIAQGYSEDDVVNGKPCVVLWPTN